MIRQTIGYYEIILSMWVTCIIDFCLKRRYNTLLMLRQGYDVTSVHLAGTFRLDSFVLYGTARVSAYTSLKFLV